MKYNVANISIDENGIWWVRWYGLHPDQGGMTRRWGEVGVERLQDLLDNLENSKELYLKLIRWPGNE